MGIHWTELVVVACKGSDLDALTERLAGHFAEATLMTVQNGLGAEEVAGAHGAWPLLSAVTFMSGTRHGDTQVEYVLDTETWIGPYRGTTPADAHAVADLIVSSGLKAAAFDDLRLDGVASSAECQFLVGTPSSTFSSGYRAYHQNSMFLYNYTLWWRRGCPTPIHCTR